MNGIEVGVAFEELEGQLDGLVLPSCTECQSAYTPQLLKPHALISPMSGCIGHLNGQEKLGAGSTLTRVKKLCRM